MLYRPDFRALLLLLCSGFPCAAQSSLTPTALSIPSFCGMAWDPTNSQLFVSTCHSIIKVDPSSGQVVDTILTGADFYAAIAVSGDGVYIYAYGTASGMLTRYVVQSHAVDVTF